MKALQLVLPGLLLHFLIPVFSQPQGTYIAQNEIAVEIDRFMEQVHENQQFSGSVLVAENGEVIYQKGFGYANAEWEVKNTPNTRFRIASITKQFTSMLVMQFVNEGLIDLSATIRTYIPEYPPKNGDVITIHHLLSNTSGMPHYEGIPDFFPEKSRQPYHVEDFMHLFWDLDRVFEPGENYRYSSFGYYLLGVILERISGKSYNELLQERICIPVGMENTRIDDHYLLESRRANGYDYGPVTDYNAPFRDMSTAFSAGALISTVTDLYKWDRALYHDELLPDSLKVKMFTPNLNNYAYGWGVGSMNFDEGSLAVHQHSGGTNGFTSLITRFPDQEHLIVLLSNVRGTPGPGLGGITRLVAQILSGYEYDLPPKTAEVELGKMLMNDPRANVRELIQGYRSTEAYAQMEEDNLISLCEHFMMTGHLDLAKKVCDYTIIEFPLSYMAYNRGAELYLRYGDEPKAIEHYQKSIDLYPGNIDAIEKLIKLGALTENPFPEVFPQPEIIDRYSGKYEIQEGFVVTVWREGKHMMGKATGTDTERFVAISDKKFYISDGYVVITFQLDEKDKVTGLHLLWDGREVIANKIE